MDIGGRLLDRCDLLCKFPCWRASLPFWHLSGSLLRKLPKILSAAPNRTVKLLKRVFTPSGTEVQQMGPSNVDCGDPGWLGLKCNGDRYTAAAHSP
jgi:hypothetical protein